MILGISSEDNIDEFIYAAMLKRLLKYDIPSRDAYYINCGLAVDITNAKRISNAEEVRHAYDLYITLIIKLVKSKFIINVNMCNVYIINNIITLCFNIDTLRVKSCEIFTISDFTDMPELNYGKIFIHTPELANEIRRSMLVAISRQTLDNYVIDDELRDVCNKYITRNPSD